MRCPSLLILPPCIQRPIIEPNARTRNSRFMRASAVPNLLILALLFPLLSLRPLSAQDRPPHKQGKAPRVSVKSSWVHRARKWLDEDVLWIITDQERADFKALTTDEQRYEFIDAFWERRNPNPGSEENTFKEEHYARFVYANERFAGGTPGWKTDRGRVYIVYGPPDEREQYPAHTDTSPATDALPQRFPAEVWRYNFIKGLGYGVFFVFLNKCGCSEYVLQQNARSQIAILYGPPNWVDHHYSDAISNCEIVGTVKGPIDWEVWHYRFIEGIGGDIGFEFSNACDYGKFEGPIFRERM